MDGSVTLYKRGNFYRCYNDDSYILAYLLDYKISMTTNSDMAGFPVNNLDKIIYEFEKNKINYIIINSIKNIEIGARKDFEYDNQYYEFQAKAYEFVKLRICIERIHDKLKKKIYEKNIESFLIELEKEVDNLK